MLNVFVAPASKPDAAKPVTSDTGRGIRRYLWAYDSSHIVFLQDKGGDENWRVYSVNTQTLDTKDLTPQEGVAAQIEGASENFPTDILVGLNDRDPRWHDLHRVSIVSGERTLVRQNDGFAGFVVDDDFRVRLAARPTPEGGMDLLKVSDTGSLEPWTSVPTEDALSTAPLGFTRDGRTLYMNESRGRDTAALKSIDFASGAEKIIAEDPRADVGGFIAHPSTGVIQAVSFEHLRETWKVLDPAIAEDMAALAKIADGDFTVTGRTLDDSKWTVAYVMDDGPARTYLYDNATNTATFLFTSSSKLEGLPLVKMHPVVIRSRDGLDLVSYLSLPPGSDADGDGRPERPVPMVLNVHGGPWGRDSWGYNPEHQWLANRGYAVLSVNFRASTGFGKTFTNAGMKEWGGKMHDDLVDAVEWAVREGVAQKDKVAIFGGSYGGYAALAGVTFTPELFACSVAIVAPSNLQTLLASIPPYWTSFFETMVKHVGDPRTEEGRKFLAERSPLTHVDKIVRPLLIGQGANDPRVKQAEADQIVQAMTAKNIPVMYVLFPDEGHGFARPQNRMAFYAVAEGFLARHLGGRAEPVGDDFEGSSVTVPAGADQLPDVHKALAGRGDAGTRQPDHPAGHDHK